jgi:hypothetical protein
LRTPLQRRPWTVLGAANTGWRLLALYGPALFQQQRYPQTNPSMGGRMTKTQIKLVEFVKLL